MGSRFGPRLPWSRFRLIALVGLGAGLCALSCPAAAGVAMAEPVPDTEASVRSEVSIDLPRPTAGSELSIGLQVAVCLDVGPVAGLAATVEIGACRQEAPSPPPVSTPTPTPPPPQPPPSAAPVAPRPVTPRPPAPKPPSPKPPSPKPPSPKPSAPRSEVPRPVPSRSAPVAVAPPREETVRRPPKRSRPAKTPRPSASPPRHVFRASASRPERRRPLSTFVIIVVLTTVIAGGVAAAFNAAR